MTKIIKLNTCENPDKFLKDLEKKELLVYEDIQGSTIYVKFTGDKFIIKPKSLKNDELNFVDLSIQKYYNKAYFFFHSLPEYITNLLNKSWWFCFEYLPDEKPANIQYDKVPRNNLILNCIIKGNKYKYNLEEIAEYSRLLDVDPLPVLFKGQLSEKQIEVINLFLTTSIEDLKFIFNEDKFSKFFYKILNPQIENSFLMNAGSFNDNLQRIVIKIDNDDEFTFEILNPLYTKINNDNNTEFVEVYSIILVNFLEFCQMIDFTKYKFTSLTRDKLYVELICNIFNDYIKNIKDDIIIWQFSIPEFFMDDKFKINVDLLSNKKTVDFLKTNEKIEYVFKVLLTSFREKKKKPIGIFTEQTLILFNNYVDTINNFLDSVLKINKEYVFKKQDLLNFEDFFDIKYNVDSEGRVYPDLRQEVEFDDSANKKKKKGIEKKK
jgi:hypothetical protein